MGQAPGVIPDVPGFADTSVVDLRDSPPLPDDDWSVTDDPIRPYSTTSQLKGIAAHICPLVGDMYVGFVEDTAMETLWGRFKWLPGQRYFKAIADFQGDKKDLTEDIGGVHERLFQLFSGNAPETVVVLGSPNSRGNEYADEYWNSLEHRSKGVVVTIWEMVIGKVQGDQVEAEDLIETRAKFP